MKKILFLILSGSLCTLNIFANGGPPPTPKPKQAKDLVSKFEIVVGYSNIKEAKLVIPQKTLQKLAGQNKSGGLTLPVASLSTGVSQTQAIAGGLFLSLAFVFGGIWLIRYRSKKLSKKSVGAGVILLFALAATFSFADVAPPSFEKIDGKIFSKKMISEQMASGKIRVVITTEEYEDTIRLMVPAGKASD